MSANLLKDFETLLSESVGFNNKETREPNLANFASGGFCDSEGTADCDDHIPHTDSECGYEVELERSNWVEGLRDFQGHVSGDDNIIPLSTLSDLKDTDANQALCCRASQVSIDNAPFTLNKNSHKGANKKKIQHGYHVKTRSQSRF